MHFLLFGADFGKLAKIEQATFQVPSAMKKQKTLCKKQCIYTKAENNKTGLLTLVSTSAKHSLRRVSKMPCDFIWSTMAAMCGACSAGSWLTRADMPVSYLN